MQINNPLVQFLLNYIYLTLLQIYVIYGSFGFKQWRHNWWITSTASSQTDQEFKSKLKLTPLELLWLLIDEFERLLKEKKSKLSDSSFLNLNTLIFIPPRWQNKLNYLCVVDIWWGHLRLAKILISIFHHFLTFYWTN